MTGPILTRMLKFAEFWKVQRAERSVVLHPPHWNRDAEIIELEDCHEVHGTNVVAMFPEVRTRCRHPARYPNDCVYDGTASGEEHRRCKYCKRLTG